MFDQHPQAAPASQANAPLTSPHMAYPHLEGALRVLCGNQRERIRWHVGAPPPLLGGSPLCQFAALPSLHKPSVLLPLDSPQGLRASLHQQARSAGSLTARLAARTLEAAAIVGLAKPLMRQRVTIATSDPALKKTPLHDFLGDVLGRRDLCLALRLAPGRPNSKPVVQIMSTEGTTLAYAKFGWEPLTRRLIHHEGRMLMALAEPTRGTPIAVPKVLHARPWHGLEALIVAPLPLTGHMPRTIGDLPTEALRCLTRLQPVTLSPLGQSPFWHAMKSRIRSLAPLLPPAIATILATAAQRVEDRWGAETIALGLKHGDWIPPNMVVRSDGSLSLWDWERGDTQAPLGMDILQFILFQALRHRLGVPFLIRRLLREAALHLVSQGLPARHCTLLAALSLLDTILWFGEAAQSNRQAVIDPKFATTLGLIMDVEIPPGKASLLRKKSPRKRGIPQTR